MHYGVFSELDLEECPDIVLVKFFLTSRLTKNVLGIRNSQKKTPRKKSSCKFWKFHVGIS